MLVATITEAKNQLSALIDRVRGGDSVVIVDRGIPVARLESAVSVEMAGDGRIARLQRAGVIRPARKPLELEVLSSEPPSLRRRASAVDALLAERQSSR